MKRNKQEQTIQILNITFSSKVFRKGEEELRVKWFNRVYINQHIYSNGCFSCLFWLLAIFTRSGVGLHFLCYFFLGCPFFPLFFVQDEPCGRRFKRKEGVLLFAMYQKIQTTHMKYMMMMRMMIPTMDFAMYTKKI